MGRSILVAALATATLAFAGAAGSGTVSVGVSSLAIRSKSVTLSWQASAPVRAVVEYGTTDEYGIWTKATDPGSSGRITLPALEPRTEYRYRMLALDTAGAQAVTAGAFRTQAIPPRSAATTTPESLLVNGQPLFPRMVFRTCSYYYASALTAGVNVFMGSGCVEPGGQLGLLGNRAYSLLTLRQRGSTGRGLIGWYHQDEPDGHGRTTLPTLPPSSLTERVSFLTLTDHFSTRSAPLPIGTAVYPRLISKADVVGFDTYPLQTRCTADFTLVFDMQRELVALARGKPTYQWIEAGPMGRCKRALDPTAATIQAEVWLAIAGGARGIGYFPDFWPPATTAAIAAANHRITALAPALLAPEVPVSFGPDGTPVKAGARLLNGAYYVIAANPSFAGATATFTVPGLTAPSLRVYGEGRSVPVSGGQFTDTFRGLGFHIYVAAPPGL